MDQIIVSCISSLSPKYPQVVELRDEILRRPLGLSIRNDDLSRDLVDAIFIAEDSNALLGCLLVHQLTANEVQLRAMAVYDRYQGAGVGRKLVLAAEAYAWGKGYDKIVLHARKVAVGFYRNLGYTITSDEFTEVGIPHYMMEKMKTG